MVYCFVKGQFLVINVEITSLEPELINVEIPHWNLNGCCPQKGYTFLIKQLELIIPEFFLWKSDKRRQAPKGYND